MRAYLVFELPPATDIYYYDTQAAELVLRGVDPYGHLFTGIPAALATPGAENVFAYLPFTAVYYVPFYLLGDIRFGSIAADMVIGLCLFQFSKRWSLAASALFLLVPFSTYYINDSVPAIALLMVSIALEGRGRKPLSSIALGIALATSMIVWLVVPFYVYRYAKGRDMRFFLLSLTAFAAISIPFFAADPSDFVYDVLLFQFGRSTPGLVVHGGPFGLMLNPSLTGMFVTLTGQPAPLYLRAAIALLLLAICLFLRRAPKGGMNGPSGGESPLTSMLLRSSVFVTAAILVLPSVFFFIYAEFPIVLFLTWLALFDGPPVAVEAGPEDSPTNT